MPLSTTGLQEGDFTALRVLKNGIMQDVLSLTSSGSPDIALNSLSIGQMSGLQAQLNSKATTATLTATAESLGGEIDALDVGVSAVANAVSATSAALVAKASLVQLGAVNTSLSSQLNIVSTLLATKTSTTALATGLAGKQDLLTDSLTLGGLTISGGDGVAFLEHNAGVAFKNSSGQTYGVFEPAGAVLGRLVVQGDLLASNTYTKTAVDELVGTYAYRLPDGALGISKVYDLQRQLDDNTAIRASILGQLGNVAGLTSFARQDIDSLTVAVNGKQGTLDSTTALDVATVSADVTVSREVRTSSLDVSGDTIANQITASTINATSMVATSGAFGKFSSERIADNGSTLYFAYGDAPFAIRFGKYASRIGINCDNKADSGLALDCIGSSRFSGTVYAGAVSAGATVINSLDDEIPFIAGNANGFLRVKNGEHIDCYSRATGVGITLNLCMHTDSAVRVGKRLVIATSPTTTYNLDVGGSGRFSGSLSAANFPSSSDARLKVNVEPVSLFECERLLRAVTPCTYKRIDMEGTPARCGYIAQDWDRELTGGFRCIMAAGENADGPLLQLDYSRIVPVLHGALLSCLARIEALESRLQ